jgi:hypothetical protein
MRSVFHGKRQPGEPDAALDLAMAMCIDARMVPLAMLPSSGPEPITARPWPGERLRLLSRTTFGGGRGFVCILDFRRERARSKASPTFRLIACALLFALATYFAFTRVPSPPSQTEPASRRAPIRLELEVPAQDPPQSSANSGE